MGQSIIYKKLSQDTDTKLKLDRVAIDLETHGRAVINDPYTAKLMECKLRPFRYRKQIYFGKDNINKVSIVSVNPKFKMIRPNKNRLKILEWK